MNKMKCTWKDCEKEGKHSQVSKDGSTWALLCDGHNIELDQALKSDVRKLLNVWVKARGGSKNAVKTMKPTIKAGARIFDYLKS
jgi:hypothetical protein